MKFKGLFSALLLALATPALAVPLGNLGPPGVAVFGNSFDSPGAFQDDYEFGLESWAEGGGNILELDFSSILGLDITSVLLNGAALDLNPVGPLNFFGTGSIGSGSHTLSILGNVWSTNCYFLCSRADVGYSGTIVFREAARPVPEPSTLGLLGLGLVAAALHRRRRTR